MYYWSSSELKYTKSVLISGQVFTTTFLYLSGQLEMLSNIDLTEANTMRLKLKRGAAKTQNRFLTLKTLVSHSGVV